MLLPPKRGGVHAGPDLDEGEDTESETADMTGSTGGLASGAVDFLRGAWDGVVSLAGVAQRDTWAPAAGFDFLRAELLAAHPQAQVLWVDTQGITKDASLPAAGAPCCSDVAPTSCEQWGGVCTPHSRRARRCETAVDDAFHTAFHSAPLASACMSTLSCLVCHGFCCRSRGRRLHRRLPTATRQTPTGHRGDAAWGVSSPSATAGASLRDAVSAHVQIGLSAADATPDDRLLISAVFVPCPEAEHAEGTTAGTKRRPVVIYCEPNMGMWEMQQRFSDSLSKAHARGMHVLLWNYRGYGLSDGSPSPAAARHDVTALKAVLLHHPALADMVGPLVIHGTSIGGLPAAELLARDDVDTRARPAAAAVFDRNFSSLPATAERMVAWWARPGMSALLPSWALDNTSLFCAATQVPRVITADALNDSIIAWPASLAASVASTLVARRLPRALSRAFPGERYSLVLPILHATVRHAAAVVGRSQVPSLGVYKAFLPNAPMPVRHGPSALNSPHRTLARAGAALAISGRARDEHMGGAQQPEGGVHDERYHSSPCCQPRARRPSGSGWQVREGTPHSTLVKAEHGQAEGEGATAERWSGSRDEEAAPLIDGTVPQGDEEAVTPPPGPSSGHCPADGDVLSSEAVVPSLAVQLVQQLGHLLQLSSFALFHRTGPMPLLQLDIYESCHPPCGQEALAADGAPWSPENAQGGSEGTTVHAAQQTSPRWRECGARPIQCAARMDSTPPDRLWCVLLPTAGVPAVNDVLWPQPWVPPLHVSEQALKWGSKVLSHLCKTRAWRDACSMADGSLPVSPVEALNRAAHMCGVEAPNAGALLQSLKQQPRALSAHRLLSDCLLLSSAPNSPAAHSLWSQAEERGRSCALSLGLQGAPPAMGYVVSALAQCWEISNGSWCTLGDFLGEHSHFRGKLDGAALGAWLSAGLTWGWASDDATLAGPEAGSAVRSLQSACTSLVLAAAVLQLPSSQAPQAKQALLRDINGALDSLNLLAHLIGAFRELRASILENSAGSAGMNPQLQQALLPEGAFLPLSGGHNGPLSPEQQAAIDTLIESAESAGVQI